MIVIVIVIVVVIVGAVVAFFGWDRYRKNTGDHVHAQPTEEVFLDPESGRRMRVWYDPQTGQRDYRPE